MAGAQHQFLHMSKNPKACQSALKMPFLHKNIMTQDAPTKKRGVQVSHVEKKHVSSLKKHFWDNPGCLILWRKFQGGIIKP